MDYFQCIGFIIPLIFMGVGVVSAEESNQKYRGYEMPRYSVSERNGNIEIRKYAEALIAEVEVTGNRDKAINEGFMILAGYIFGNNVSKEKISMTTPVSQSQTHEKIAMTTPVVQSGSDDRWTVQFMMPSKYTLKTLPSAKDSRIQFRIVQPVKMIVVRFSGSITQRNLSKNLKKLEGFIEQNKLMVQRPPRYAFYDAPWTLPFMRRNEIAFVLMETDKDNN